jgi:hypothetical protein
MPAHSDQMEQILKDFAQERATQNLGIVYSDMHSLWGGVTITLLTSGVYECLMRPREILVPSLVRKTVTAAQIQEVVQLLLELQVWEQQKLERVPMADEARATLILRTGDVETSIWELYKNLERNRRIIQVRRLLLDLVAINRQ